jgi:hypothetical protein
VFQRLFLGDAGGEGLGSGGPPEEPYDCVPMVRHRKLEDRVMEVEDSLADAREGLDYARQLKSARVELYMAVVALGLLSGFIGGSLAVVLYMALTRTV